MVKTFSDPFDQVIISLLPKKYQKALLLVELGFALSDVIKKSVATCAHPDTIAEMSEEKIDKLFLYLESVSVRLEEFTEQFPAEVEK